MLPSTTDNATMQPHSEAPDVKNSGRGFQVLLIVTGAIGLVASVVLLVEKIALIENPDYIPTCSISPVLSCGSVMTTDQAAAFGIPNPIVGIAGFAAVTSIGMGLLAGARFRPWFWLLTQAGVSFAVVFIHWLSTRVFTSSAPCAPTAWLFGRLPSRCSGTPPPETFKH